jgi:hypothetical protein
MIAPVSIANLDDLWAIASWKETLTGGRSVKLDLPLATDQRRTWEENIHRHTHTCGCKEGQIALSLFVPAAGIAWFAGWMQLAMGWRGGLEVFALLFVAALVGKIAGLVMARVRLRQTVREIAAAMPIAGR